MTLLLAVRDEESHEKKRALCCVHPLKPCLPYRTSKPPKPMLESQPVARTAILGRLIINS